MISNFYTIKSNKAKGRLCEEHHTCYERKTVLYSYKPHVENPDTPEAPAKNPHVEKSHASQALAINLR